MTTSRLFRSALIPLLSAALAGSALAHEGHDHHQGPTMNFHAIDDELMTGGHFVDDGLEQLQADGVTVVIDLRDAPPKGQEKKLAGHGMKWVNIPVSWSDPKPEDFDAFAEAMKAHEGEKILVQCQANYRASAMTYLYRVEVEGVSERKARKDLNAVWSPEGTWREYMEGIADR